MKPDQSLFMAHLEEAPFQSGVDAGRWGVVGKAEEISWPHPIIWIAGNKSVVSGSKIYLRFTVDSYPETAPTACPWDVQKNARLELSHWPKVTGKLARVFRIDWNGVVALYAPCDTVAMPGHEIWKQQFPKSWWQSSFTIEKCLSFVHLCLNPLQTHDDAN